MQGKASDILIMEIYYGLPVDDAPRTRWLFFVHSTIFRSTLVTLVDAQPALAHFNRLLLGKVMLVI